MDNDAIEMINILADELFGCICEDTLRENGVKCVATETLSSNTHWTWADLAQRLPISDKLISAINEDL